MGRGGGALGCGKRREGPGRPPAGRPGGGGRGPPGLISSSAGAAHPKLGPVRAPRQPASMQLRRRPLSAPRPGHAPRPSVLAVPLLLLLLLALQGAAASGSPRTPGGSRTRSPRSRLLSQAARAALHFFNFRAASPSALQVLANVLDGRAWVKVPEQHGAREDRPPAARAVTASARARAGAPPARTVCARCGDSPEQFPRLEGPVRGAESAEARTCSFWHLQGRKEFSQGSSHTWETGTWGN